MQCDMATIVTPNGNNKYPFPTQARIGCCLIQESERIPMTKSQIALGLKFRCGSIENPLIKCMGVSSKLF